MADTAPAEEDGPPVKLTTEQRAAFHQAEYTAMKAGIVADTNAVNANFQYAVSLSGAAAAWLLTKLDSVPPGLVVAIALAAAWWLPLIVSSLLATLSSVIGKRLKMKGNYVKRLEGHFRFADLGWERASERTRSGLIPQHEKNWLVLLILDGLLGVVGSVIQLILSLNNPT